MKGRIGGHIRPAECFSEVLKHKYSGDGNSRRLSAIKAVNSVPQCVCAPTETMSSGLSSGSLGLGTSVGNVSLRALRASRDREALWGEDRRS